MMHHSKDYHPLTVDRVFIDIAGSLDGGVFLSYLFDCGKEESGDWFSLAQEKCERILGIKRTRREHLCAQFMSQQLLETKISGLPARTHYRANPVVLQSCVNRINKQKEVLYA